MEEKDIIQLKKNYCIFQEQENVCVYEKDTKRVILKLKAGENAFSDKVRDDLSRPQNVKWLSKQPYWKWLGKLMMKYGELFEVLEPEKLKAVLMEKDYFSVVDRTHFAENYIVEHEFHEGRIILFGDTKINRALVLELSERVKNLIIIQKEIDRYALDHFETEADFDYKIVKEEKMEDLDIRSNDTILFDATGMDQNSLLQWNHYFTQKQAVLLFYGNGLKQAVIGPLVVGGESACLECLKKDGQLNHYYCGENGYVDRTNLHLFLLFILRTIYYIKENNLFYLLSDSQIPINKVFVINKLDLSAKLDYVYRDVDCECNC